jgi:nitroimidazol reductase NimA-like FMN-containing flavoprotein (pyridoxamine 5'-phosphate oxidase superfamily)
MKYHVRRSEREIIDEKELQSILEKGKYGIVGLSKNDEPYVVTFILQRHLGDPGTKYVWHTLVLSEERPRVVQGRNEIKREITLLRNAFIYEIEPNSVLSQPHDLL